MISPVVSEAPNRTAANTSDNEVVTLPNESAASTLPPAATPINTNSSAVRPSFT
jgi:hypothetical protein